ncbi:MAG: phosphotransferase enzyme family protein [Chloroflexota bacterium]
MLEPPALPDETIIASVRASYGLAVAALTFLPIGNDSSTWVYRLQAANRGVYFLKLRKGAANEPSFAVPRYLSDHGVTHVVAALPTAAGTLWVDVDGFALALYPFIDGTTGTDAGMAERHWITYGATLRQIHGTALPLEIARHMRRETFTPDGSAVVKRLDAHLAARPVRSFTDPSERELAAFWHDRRDELRTLVDRAKLLGRQLRATSPPLVLCHADFHTWNVLIDTADRLWIVDWDETVLAPRERDLMFVVGGLSADLVGPRKEAWFFAGYGATTVDPLALAYYRYAWALSDIGDYGERVFSRPGMGGETKRAAVQGAMSCFQPGRIVALAYEADRLQADPRTTRHS